MITEEHYLKLRAWLNNGKEYEYLRKEYEALRFTFNNQKIHHSVWNYDIAKKKGHITPKPIELIKNIILHSSKEGQVILDCYTVLVFVPDSSVSFCRLNTRYNLGTDNLTLRKVDLVSSFELAILFAGLGLYRARYK